VNWVLKVARPQASLDTALVDRAKELLKSGMAVAAVARELGYLWPPGFGKRFKALVGCSPTEWLLASGTRESVAAHVARAERVLLAGNYKLAEAAPLAGFNSSQAMTMAFKAVHGMSASEWLRRNRRVMIEVMEVPSIRRKEKK
jgi:AraC-like DNA-binding protein